MNKFVLLMTQDPSPNITFIKKPSGTTPPKIRAVAILSLISGIINTMLGISWIGTGLHIFIIGIFFTIIPGAYCLSIGILNILYSLKLFSSEPQTIKPSKHLAILDLISILCFNPISFGIGVANLILYADKEVEIFFKPSQNVF